MRGLEKNYTSWHRHTVMATLRLNRPSGADSVKIVNFNEEEEEKFSWKKRKCYRGFFLLSLHISMALFNFELKFFLFFQFTYLVCCNVQDSIHTAGTNYNHFRLCQASKHEDLHVTRGFKKYIRIS